MNDPYSPELSATGYANATGVERDEYERRLVAALRSTLLEPCVIDEWHADGSWRTRQRIGTRAAEIDSGELTGSGDDDAVVEIVFRPRSDSSKRYGIRADVWPAPDPSDMEMGTPEGVASMLVDAIDEEIEAGPGLPPHRPGTDSVHWIESS